MAQQEVCAVILKMWVWGSDMQDIYWTHNIFIWVYNKNKLLIGELCK